MAGRKSDFTLPTLDDLFSTQELRDDAKLSKIRDIPLELIDDFPDHPFKVRDDEDKQAELYDELADLVEATVQTDSATEPTEQIPYSEEKMLLPELAGLYQQNGDLVGWINIADTNINYPVMQSVNEPNFYLKHGFDKEYSDYGCPYVQEDCDVQEPSDNLVIYGHHMSNGSMFAHLEKFKNKDFWSEHRMITFNTD